MGSLAYLLTMVIGNMNVGDSDKLGVSHKPRASQTIAVSGQETARDDRDSYRVAQLVQSLAQARVNMTGIDPEEDAVTGPASPWTIGDPENPMVIGTTIEAVDDGIPSPTIEEFIATEEALAERVAAFKSGHPVAP